MRPAPGPDPLLPRPVFASRQEYSRNFNNLAFGEPYVDDVLGRHGLVRGGLGAGAGDTFPTVLAGSFVVKFFPRRFDGGACFF